MVEGKYTFQVLGVGTLLPEAPEGFPTRLHPRELGPTSYKGYRPHWVVGFACSVCTLFRMPALCKYHGQFPDNEPRRGMVRFVQPPDLTAIVFWELFCVDLLQMGAFRGGDG